RAHRGLGFALSFGDAAGGGLAVGACWSGASILALNLAKSPCRPDRVSVMACVNDALVSVISGATPDANVGWRVKTGREGFPAGALLFMQRRTRRWTGLLLRITGRDHATGSLAAPGPLNCCRLARFQSALMAKRPRIRIEPWNASGSQVAFFLWIASRKGLS